MVFQVPPENAQDAASCFEISQSFNTGPIFKDFDREPHVLKKDIVTKKLLNVSVSLENVPGTPLVLSPTSSVSTPSSPNISGFSWDTPETPERQSSSKGDYRPLTPLTPLVTSDDLGQACKLQVKSPFFPSNFAIQNPESVKAGPQCAQNTPIPQEAASKKLFSGIEGLISGITNESSKLPNPYNNTPSFDFTRESKPRSSDTKFRKQENEATGSHVKVENIDTNSVPADTLHPKCGNKGFQTLLEQIIPSEIHNRLKDDSKLCVASKVTKLNERCTRKRTAAVSSAYETLKCISDCINKGEYAGLLEFIERLVKVLACRIHENVVLRRTKARSRMDTLRDFITNISTAPDAEVVAFKAWAKNLAKLSHLVDCGTPSKTNTTGTNPVIIQSNLPGFLPYISKEMDDLSIVKDLKVIIEKPLTKHDMKNGFIYMFWNEGIFGMIKIGHTNDLDRRMKEWKECKATHSYHPFTHEGKPFEIPHVPRVKKLIHMELINERKKLPCNTCQNEMHDEWFCVAEAKATKIFEKWHSWILQEPYAKGDDGEWRIKPEMLHLLPELCKPEPTETLTLLTLRKYTKKTRK